MADELTERLAAYFYRFSNGYVRGGYDKLPEYQKDFFRADAREIVSIAQPIIAQAVAAARAETFEEAALIADEYADHCQLVHDIAGESTAEGIAKGIRAAASKGE